MQKLCKLRMPMLLVVAFPGEEIHNITDLLFLSIMYHLLRKNTYFNSKLILG